MILAKVASKSMDYSVFRAGKELLYLPLSHQERTQGKAIVDMMTYRVAKGGASIFILVMTTSMATPHLSTMLALSISGVWLVLTFRLMARYTRVCQRVRIDNNP